MIHDIAITEQYVVFNDLPLQFKPENVALGQGAFWFNKDMSARYGIMKRDCQNTDEIMWFDLPNHYVFHFANAWEKKAPNGDEMVIMFGCALKDVNLIHTHSNHSPDGSSEHPFLWESHEKDNRGKLTKFEFNLTTGESNMTQLVDEASDFPLIDMEQIGYESQYVYLTYFAKDIPQEKNGVYSQYFDGVYKYDMINEKIVEKIKFGENKSAGEVFFQKRDYATSEDDGYLMTFVYDWVENKSEFMMWDAKTMEKTPVVRAAIKQRVPNGFHTTFVQEKDI